MPLPRAVATRLLCVLSALAVVGCSSRSAPPTSNAAASAPLDQPHAAAPLPAGEVPEGTAPGPSPAPEGARAVVVHHVDGDTLDVHIAGIGRERLRLIGINTPETKKPRSPVECYGPEASQHLAELLPVGSDVVVLRDVEPRDDYGRFLAYVFRRSDGLFVNLAMAADGYARVLSIEPNTLFAVDVSRAVSEARAGRRGLWGSCPD